VINQRLSNACGRLVQPYIDRVFRLAIEGTPVVIKP
jgi:hypothetical protein